MKLLFVSIPTIGIVSVAMTMMIASREALAQTISTQSTNVERNSRYTLRYRDLGSFWERTASAGDMDTEELERFLGVEFSHSMSFSDMPFKINKSGKHRTERQGKDGTDKKSGGKAGGEKLSKSSGKAGREKFSKSNGKSESGKDSSSKKGRGRALRVGYKTEEVRGARGIRGNVVSETRNENDAPKQYQSDRRLAGNGCWYEMSKSGSKDGSKSGSKDGSKSGSKSGSKDGRARRDRGRRLIQMEGYECKDETNGWALCCKGYVTVGTTTATSTTTNNQDDGTNVIENNYPIRPQVPYIRQETNGGSDSNDPPGGVAEYFRGDNYLHDRVENNAEDDYPNSVVNRPVPYISQPAVIGNADSKSNDILNGNI
uniref:Uncharacterized protein n=1 Tax=Pseudo-nitzschia australis TaxID=44445 RepID=A0A7S4AJ56_9STRA